MVAKLRPLAAGLVGCALALCTAPLLAADSGYIGSHECKGCHTRIYDAWAATRHATSVLTAVEARDAGYPLPRVAEAGSPAVDSWDDLSYVVGGRQRIAYADADGRVLGSSYHHRLARWSDFPAKSMTACGPCHYTGFDPVAAAGGPTLPLPAAERNIGCESCHGPGRRHTETLEPEDIDLDASSRSCGTCHTSVGRVLPRDDLHDTHDVVQVWNRDRHATSLHRHSQTAFCAGCHSPREAGPEATRQDGTGARVFSEDRQGIACSGCHDPHASTDPRYRRDRVELGPPRPPRRQVYRGDDGDFTTRDFTTVATTVEACEQCHRGADRIDLDHADATCEDCHNTFSRNRGRESRAFRDANHRSLSCRPCHADADHLMAVARHDPAFGDPEALHDLRTVPAEVAQRYGFRYAGLRPRRLIVLPDDPGALDVPEALSAARLPQPGTHVTDHGRLERVLRKPAHVEAADQPAVRSAQEALRARSDAPEAWASLARACVAAGRPAAARDVLEESVGPAAAKSFRQLLFRAGAGRATSADAGPAAAPAPGESREALAIRRWADGFGQLAAGRFEAAAQTLGELRDRGAESAALRLHLALAGLGARRGETIATLDDALARYPAHVTTRVAAGVVSMSAGRMAPAVEHLEAANAADPANALAHYWLGRVQLRLGNPLPAAEALRHAVRADPAELNAWFFLAQAYRLAGLHGAAVETYQALIRERPELFHPRNELAVLYKYLSDRLAYGHREALEAPAPHGIAGAPWRAHVERIRRRSLDYAELALAELRRAEAVGELDVHGTRQVAEIHRRAGRLDEAVAALDRLTDREPGWWIGPYRVGTLRLAQGDPAAAARSLERAVRLAPTEGAPYVALGLARIRERRLKDAVRILERGAVHDPFSPAMFTNLGAALAGLGELERARAALERSLRLDTFPLPRSHLAHTNLAMVSIRQGDRNAAARELRRALRTFPDFAPARELLQALTAGDEPALAAATWVHDDLLEIAGEVTTVAFRP